MNWLIDVKLQKISVLQLDKNVLYFLAAVHNSFKKNLCQMWFWGFAGVSELKIKGRRIKKGKDTKGSIMPRHKDITSLETIPAATILERKTCLDLLPLSSSSVFSLYLSQISQSQKKIHTRLNHCGTAWMNEWQIFHREKRHSSQGTLLSFE